MACLQEIGQLLGAIAATVHGVLHVGEARVELARLGKANADGVGRRCGGLHAVNSGGHRQEQVVVGALLLVEQAQDLELQIHVVGVGCHSGIQHGDHVGAVGDGHKHRFNVALGFFVTLDVAVLACFLGTCQTGLHVIRQGEVVGQHLGAHVRLRHRVSLQLALHRVETGCVVLVQCGGRGFLLQTIDALFEHLVRRLVLVTVVLVKVGGLPTEHFTAVVGAALGAWVQFHALVVQVEEAVHQDRLARVFVLHFFQFLADEGCPVRIQAFARRFWAHVAGLSPLDVSLVVVLLLLVRLVDTQGFLALELLVRRVAVAFVLGETRGGRKQYGQGGKEGL